MKKFTTLLVSTFAVFVISWTANAADLEATTDEGKRVLLNDDMTWQYIESKQDKADKKLGNALVKFAQWLAKQEGEQSNVPFEECYKSLIFKEMINNPSPSEEDLMYRKLLTVDNLHYLTELSKEEAEEAMGKLFEKDKNAELTKDDKLMGLMMGLAFAGMECSKLLE